MQIKLSIVIPVYNGAKSIETLVHEIFNHLSRYAELEVILVNDCSPDESWKKIVSLQKEYTSSLTAVNLAKNVGEHNAVMAGYHFCRGDYIVNIDDDFQNPPAEILKLLDKIKKGYDAVYSIYVDKKHSLFRNLGSKLNDKMANVMLRKPGNLYLSSFRIISAQLLKTIIQYDGPHPYIDGLILRATSRIAQVQVEHSSRERDTSNYTLVKLVRLWSHMFFNFSLIPLRTATLLGLIFSIVGVLGAIVFLIEKLFYPGTQIGWASLIISIWILSGIQLFMTGIIGEYIGRIFLAQSKTPQFVIHQVLNKVSPHTPLKD